MRSRDLVAAGRVAAGRVAAGGVAAGAVAAGAHLVPSVAAIGPLRTRLVPRLCGLTRIPHVALTFDDGPDPDSTPRVLETLERLDVRATFFVLGRRVVQHPEVSRKALDAGHDIAVHGWTHRPQLLRTPLAIQRDLAQGVAAVEEAVGVRPGYWRPPRGIPTGAGFLAARRHGLRPVLWSADGRDWQAGATVESINDRIMALLGPGGVVLLHDSDALCAPGSWRTTLAALPELVAACRDRGWKVGPLSEHGLEARHAHR